MFVGHYASALVAYERERQAPLWLFLVAAIALDLVMYAFVGLGIERMDLIGTAPQPKFVNIDIDMTFSHDLVPVLGWMVLVGGAGYAITRSRSVALWCAGLVVFHELCDLVVGFPHHVMGVHTPEVGIGLYHTGPMSGWLIEGGLSLACVFWFVWRTDLPRWRAVALVGIVAFACLSSLGLSR